MCQFLHDIKIPSGASETRARGVCTVKKLNKCTVNILVYNLCLDCQRNICSYTAVFSYTGILS